MNNLGKYNINSASDAIFNSDIYSSIINFDYTENNLAFYVEARKKVKKFNFTAGLRFEDYHVDRIGKSTGEDETRVQYKNSNFFPNISALYELNDQMNVSASYSKKISQPNYNTIDPNNSNAVNQFNTSCILG